MQIKFGFRTVELVLMDCVSLAGITGSNPAVVMDVCFL
jgi:hypothetical protein